jgi:thiamine monophosphate kinase
VWHEGHVEHEGKYHYFWLIHPQGLDNGGEDYELLMTIDQKHYDQLKNHMDFTIIGHATAMEGKHQLHTTAGNVFDIKAQGWQHFKQEEK